jgi:predicted HAD superfamily phosphohydrolase YqeG
MFKRLLPDQIVNTVFDIDLDELKARGVRGIITDLDNTLVSAKTPLARKPAGAAFRRAIKLMELTSEQAVVVGDQMLTDVLGGRRAGLHTILVTPIAPREEGWATQINRRIEKIALARLRKKGLWPDKGGR